MEDDKQAIEFFDRFYREWIAVSAAYDEYARACGMTPTQYYLLWTVSDLGGKATQKAVAAELSLPKQTVASAVAKAKREGLLETLPNPEDARSSLIRLTEAGRALLGPVDRGRVQLETEASREVDAEDARASLRMLETFGAGLRESLDRWKENHPGP